MTLAETAFYDKMPHLLSLDVWFLAVGCSGVTNMKYELALTGCLMLDAGGGAQAGALLPTLTD